MSEYQTIAIPFKTEGNKKYLEEKQLAESSALTDFFERFRHCFRLDEMRYIVWVEPPEG